MSKTPASNLIDQFYGHVDENDWLDGVDLYQAGKVTKPKLIDGLISAAVADYEPKPAEVRIKIHQNAQYIQWIECTCKKNRAKGYYCEHIAAVMLCIDREYPTLFARLDAKMPIKPPAVAPRSKLPKPAKLDEDDGTKGSAGAAHTILSHLKGSIHSVSLVAHGPTLRVRLEIKSGQLTSYDLGLDESAAFLQKHQGIAGATPEVAKLKVFSTPACLGTRFFTSESEEIGGERCVAVPITAELVELAENVPTGATKAWAKRAAGDGVVQETTFFFLPIKKFSKYIGSQFVYIPGFGYFPYDKNLISTSWGEAPLTATFKDDKAAELVKTSFKTYLEQGPIYVDEMLAKQSVIASPKLSSIKVVGRQDGWFQLDPVYGAGDNSISMVSLLKQAKKERRKFIKSGDVWLEVPDLVTEYDWQVDASGEHLQVDAVGLMRLKATLGEFDHFGGSKTALQQIRQSTEFTADMPTPSLGNSLVKLRNYQEVGLRWLWWLYKNNLHGLLADEMGLGKTHQAMALMIAIANETPTAKFIVICPTTVLDHWLDKVEQFAPELKPIKYHGQQRMSLLKRVEQEPGLVITSYGVLIRDVKQLSAIKWEVITLDEAHFVKNSETATYSAVCRMPAKIRICLTGTPMENTLYELKNVFDFLVPGYLGSDEYFQKNFVQPLSAGAAPEVEVALQKLIYPLKLRRIKTQVLPDLPAKVEDLRHCALSEEQVKLYRDVVEMKSKPLIAQLQDDKAPVSFLHVFATISLLKQICDHPALVVDKANYKNHSSGKFELLKELLQEAFDSDHKVVIFTQYLGMVAIIESYLKEIGIKHVILTGQSRNRGEIISAFQNDTTCKVFVGSLLAGGIGIDLTAASEVIHYDRWWNASKENQATDRVHRIGQTKNVQVLKLVTRGTLEEKIDRLIAAKAALFEKFMDRDEEVFKNMSRSELIDLLQ